MEIGETVSRITERFRPKEGLPQIHYFQMYLTGRAGQDGIRIDTIRQPTGYLQELWRLAGIYFMAGVFDGHGKENNTGSKIAKIAFEKFQYYLAYYFRQNPRANFEKALKTASNWTDQRLLKSEWWQNRGVCFEMVIAAKDGLYLVHLGDGQTYLRDNKGKIQLLTTPHKPPGGRVAGILAVNRSWGDGNVKKTVGIQALSPIPDVIKKHWKELQGASLLLTTDGLPSLAKDSIPEALQTKLSQDFQKKVRTLMDQRNQAHREGKINVPADDVSCLLLEFK